MIRVDLSRALGGDRSNGLCRSADPSEQGISVERVVELWCELSCFCACICATIASLTLKVFGVTSAEISAVFVHDFTMRANLRPSALLSSDIEVTREEVQKRN